MKKILLLLGIVALFSTWNVCAQGTVLFGTTSVAQVIQINCIPCQEGQATVALYGNVLGSSANELVQLGATTLTLNFGAIAGGIRTLSNVPGGAMGTFQIRAWTGGFATFEAAAASGFALLGVSAVFNNATGNPNGSPPTPPANLTGWTSPVNIMPLTPFPCPEPSAVMLGSLGAASLWFFRRR